MAKPERPVDCTCSLPEWLLWGLVSKEEVIIKRNGLPALIQAYKAIIMALYLTDPVNHNINLNPKFKKLIFSS
jgi:hypothetical protein